MPQLKLYWIILSLCLTQPLIYAQEQSVSTSTFDKVSALSDGQWVKDSLQVNAWSDTLKNNIQNKFKSDSLKTVLQRDSLHDLNLPTDRVEARYDSLQAKRQELLTEVDAKRQSLLNKTRNRLETWKDKVRAGLGLDSLKTGSKTANIPDKIPGDINAIQDKIPGTGDITLPTGDIPKIPTLPEGDIPPIPELKVGELEELNLSPDLKSLQEVPSIKDKLPVDNIPGISDIKDKVAPVSEYTDKIKMIKEDPSKGVESSVTQIKEVKQVQEKIGGAEALKKHEALSEVEKLKDQEAIKKALKEKAAKQAVDHFAGKEEQLQQAMQQLSKYKQKYSSLQSLQDIPKRRPNEMRGKPLVERLLPGVAFQIQKRNNVLLDVNVYTGYRFTGRLTSGLGWNQRFAFDSRERNFSPSQRIYGGRLYTEFKALKGFSLRLEPEMMNTYVPPVFTVKPNDAGEREWVFSVMGGIKKEYAFLKNVKGTMMMYYNLYNRHHKSPYVDRLNIRFGFEFPMKKKSKTPKTTEVKP